ncbi:MAG: amino acid--tRNA ligase-related protein, partial [Bacilli bacterium]
MEGYQGEAVIIRELYDALYFEDTSFLEALDVISIEGWIKTNRDNGQIGFIELNDGTYFKGCQIVYNKQTLSNYDEISKVLTGSAIKVSGQFILTPQSKQPFELQATSIEVLGESDNTYPLQKKRHSLEYLREIPHLRVRTNTFMAVMRVRSLLSMAIHEFFQDQGFVYVQTPIITSNDAEGAGEAFVVKTSDEKSKEEFFGKKASLSVSGQLHVEAYAL